MDGSSSRPSRPSSRHAFRIAIICALPLEAEMVQLVFDHYWHDEGITYGKAAGDQNTYTTGMIGKHNVVLAHMAEIGSNSAASLAAGLRSSYRGIEIAFIVGVCGVVPIHRETKEEIILGDCIISTGVIQYDFGRQYPQGFVSKNTHDDASSRMSTEIKSLISMLKAQPNQEQLSKRLVEHLQVLQSKRPNLVYPGIARDRLFEPSYLHQHHQGCQCDDCLNGLQVCLKDCDSIRCADGPLIERQRLRDHTVSSTGSNHVLPHVHLGRFGSANTVMKSGLDRDRIAEEGQLIAFEMEGAGVLNNIPTLLVRSACDYADSHKSKEWQNYAAATAAAGLKALLGRWDAADEVIETGIVNLSINEEKQLVVEQQPVSTSAKHMIPLQRNRRFIGRESKLQELEDRLFIQKECQQLAIYGLGGVGKSQLALEFCYIVKARYPDYSIFWVSLMSDARCKQDYTKLASLHSLPSSDMDQLVPTVHDYLGSEEAGKWLMIVDNADDKKLIFEDESEASIFGRLSQNQNGIVLFTTRFKEIAVEVADGNITSLNEMGLQEAKTFLSRSLRNDKLIQDEDSIEELLEELAYLPLAITQASSYITKKSITIPKYLALMRNTEEETVKLLSRDFWDTTKETRNAVAVTWLVTFDQIRREDHIARDILFFLSYIENKTIPLAMLPGGNSDVEKTDAVGILVGYSFLTDQGNEIYDMHRLVQLAVKIWMRREEGLVQEWKQKSISHLVDICPDCTWETRALWLPMITHTVRILNDARQDSTLLKGKPHLYLFLAQCLKLEEWFIQGHEWAINCIMLEEFQQEDGWFHTKALRYLAMLCNTTGRAQEALILFQHVANVVEDLFAEDHPARLVAQYDLAGCYTRLGQTGRAVEVLQAVVDRAQVIIEDEVDRLGYEHALAEAYHLNDQQKEAIELEQRVVPAAARLYAEDHPFQYLCRNVLGFSYLDDGRVEDALEILQEVHVLEFGRLREDHPSRLMTQYGLAKVSAAMGDSDDALLRMLAVVCMEQKSKPIKITGQTATEETLLTLLDTCTDVDLSKEGETYILGELLNRIEGYPRYTFSSYVVRWDADAKLAVTKFRESYLINP